MRFIQIVGAIQLLLAAWSLLSSVTAGTQPLITCERCHMLLWRKLSNLQRDVTAA